MYKRTEATAISELFKPMSQRPGGKSVFFVRVCQISPEIRESLWKYHEVARTRGIILEGQIANPDERQLNFLIEMLGSFFQPTPSFITDALQKWMPRMQQSQRIEFAQNLCARFDELKRKGKTDSILRNIYLKIMCWLYYKFERLIPYLGQDDSPKILYETNSITAHELLLLRILSSMGADILLLEPLGDQAYLKQDPDSAWSQILSMAGSPFPKDFSLKQFRKEMSSNAVSSGYRSGLSSVVQKRVSVQQPTSQRPTVPQGKPPLQGLSMQERQSKRAPESYFPKPSRSACTNAWMKEAAFTEILTPIVNRGDDSQFFYNAFIRIKGVFDKLTYMNELFCFYQQLKSTGRNIVIIDDELLLPSPEEVQKIRRHPYRTAEEMIIDLAGNLPACANIELQRLMQQAFVRIMVNASEREDNLNHLVVSAVYLLCWIRQYQAALFQGYKDNEIPCFILMGGCKNQHDALYIRYLSQLPVDVLILACDLNRSCTVKDEHLLELTGSDSFPVPKFPRDASAVQMRTFASNAEQDLTSILYTDSGMYRNRQFSKANAITLQSTYDEIFILWDQELKYRPNFSTVDQAVNMPVIFAKVSGVELGKTEPYWQKIKALTGEHVRLFKSFPLCSAGNPYQSLAVKALCNGKLKREDIKAHRQYPFGLLREELQEHIFDKLQLMLDHKLIKGTFVNGTEYTIVATILNLEKGLVRMLQSFDFTKKNPKVIVISTSEQSCTLEDAILITFLNLIGFDVVLFVPTGYQTIERYLNDNYPVEHQIGDYLYDLQIPDFSTLPQPKSRSWLDHILKRGN